MADFTIIDVPFQAGVGTIHRIGYLNSAASPSTGGTFTMTVEGQTTSAIAFNATPATVQSALEALSNVAPGDVSVSLFLNGPTLATASTSYQLDWGGGAFQDTNPSVTIDTTGLTGGTPHVLLATLRQKLTASGGPGTTPKGAIGAMVAATALDTITAVGCRLTRGYYDGTNQLALGYYGQNGAAAASAGTGWGSDSGAFLILPGVLSSTASARAVAISFGTDSITFDWTVGKIPSAGRRGVVRLFFGSDCQCATGAFATSSSIGGTAGPGSAPGFQLDGLEIMGVGQAIGAEAYGNEGLFSIGYYGRTSNGQALTAVVAEHQESNTSSGSYVRNDAISAYLTSTAGTVAVGPWIDVTSVTSTTFQVTTRNQATAIVVGYFAFRIGGQKVYAGLPALATSSTGVKSFTTPGFRPGFLAITGSRQGGHGVINSGAGGGSISLGTRDLTKGSTRSVLFRDNRPTSEGVSEARESRIASVLTTGSARDWAAQWDSYTATGFDYNVTDSSAADRETAVMVIEEPIQVVQTGNGIARGSALARAVGTILKPATGRSRGAALTRGKAGAVRTGAASVRGSSLLNVAATRLRTAEASSHGAAITAGTAARVKPATGVSRGAAITQSAATAIRTGTGISHGAALAVGTAAAVRTGQGTSYGAARTQSAATAIRTGSGNVYSSARAVGAGARLKPATGQSNGAAITQSVTTKLRTGTGQAQGSTILQGSPTRTRTGTATSQGASQLTGAATRTRTAAGRSHGASTLQGVAVVVAVGANTGRSRGHALAYAMGTRIRVAIGSTHGAAITRGVAAILRTGTGVSHGSAITVGTPTRLQTATGNSRGAALANVAATRERTGTGTSHGAAITSSTPTRARTGTGTSHGAAITQGVAVVEAVGANTGIVHGAALARATGTVIRVATGTAHGSSLLRGVASIARTGTGTSHGSAITVGTPTRLQTATGASRGSALAQSVAVAAAVASASSRGSAIAFAVGVITRTASGVSHGAARTVSVASISRTGTGEARGSATVVGTASRELSGTGISYGAARAVLTETVEKLATGQAYGISRARGIGTRTRTCPAATPTDLDLRILPKVLDILQRLGREVTLLDPIDAYDAGTGVNARTFNEQVVLASPPLAFGDRYVDGEIIRVGDCRLIVQGDGLTADPIPGTEVEFDGTRWTAISVSPIYSGEQIAAWDLQIRGAKQARESSTSTRTALDARLPARVTQLIGKFGKQVKFHVVESRIYDPSSVDAEGECEFCEKVVLDMAGTAYRNGDTSNASGIKAYLKADNLGFTPYKSCLVDIGTEKWRVVSATSHWSGGRMALWELELAR